MAILPKFVGARIKRREDPALIQGLGQYVDDIPMAGTLHAAFLRSPYAHARITGLHVEAARQHPGVVAVLTGHDILGKVGTIPCVAAAPGLKLPVQHALAVGQGGVCRPASGRGGGGESLDGARCRGFDRDGRGALASGGRS